MQRNGLRKVYIAIYQNLCSCPNHYAQHSKNKRNYHQLTIFRSKIGKGDLRFGTFVDVGKFQSWKWRHWGCVTERVLRNVNKKFEGDIKNCLDGFNELNDPIVQEKILRAFEQGHVDEEDEERCRKMASDASEEKDRKIEEGELTSEEEKEPIQDLRKSHKRKSVEKSSVPNKKHKAERKRSPSPKIEILEDDEEIEDVASDKDEEEKPWSGDEEDDDELVVKDSEDETEGVSTIASQRPRRSARYVKLYGSTTNTSKRRKVDYAESGNEYSDSD